MADIKTKDAIKGTIKTIDKAAVAADRMRSAYIQTKEKAEHSTNTKEDNAEEYASDRIEEGVDKITHEAVYQFGRQGRNGVKAAKQNISKAQDKMRQFKEKRTAENLKRQAVGNKPIVQNKEIRAAEQTPKTIKQTARSSGKKSIKMMKKGEAKATQKGVKTAERTAKTSIKTTKEAAKNAQKTAKATAKATQKSAQIAKKTVKAIAKGIKVTIKAAIAQRSRQ